MKMQISKLKWYCLILALGILVVGIASTQYAAIMNYLQNNVLSVEKNFNFGHLFLRKPKYWLITSYRPSSNTVTLRYGLYPKKIMDNSENGKFVTFRALDYSPGMDEISLSELPDDKIIYYKDLLKTPKNERKFFIARWQKTDVIVVTNSLISESKQNDVMIVLPSEKVVIHLSSLQLIKELAKVGFIMEELSL